MNKPKVAIVAPVHIQVSDSWSKSLESVANSYGAKVIIVDDSDGKVQLPDSFDVYGYKRQEQTMGSELYEGFKQFQKSSSCKNFGTWLAYKEEYDVVIVIDSDCIVPPDLISKHLEALDMVAHGWQNPILGTGFFSRGFPYHERERRVISNMGLWSNELDLYGTDRVGIPHENIPQTPILYREHEIAHGIIPYSGMNIAVRREAIPALLFLPNIDVGDWKFRREDDIWGGYIFQKIAQKMNDKLTFGLPIVYHDTIVVPEEDAEEEKAMIHFEEDFFSEVDYHIRRIGVYKDCTYERAFEEFADSIDFHRDIVPPTVKFSLLEFTPAFNFWVEAFK